MIGRTVRTVHNWKTKGNWDKLKAARTLTRQALLANQYNAALQIQKQWFDAKGEQRPPTSSEIDMLAKIAAFIEKLDKSSSLPVIIEVFMAFGKWLASVDPEAARTLTKHQNQYLKIKANE